MFDDGASCVILGVAAIDKLSKEINSIKMAGHSLGAYLSPDSEIKQCTDYLPYLDIVLLKVDWNDDMEDFQNIVKQIAEDRRFLARINSNTKLAVIAAPSEYNVKQLVDHGVDYFVFGKEYFSSPDYYEKVSKLKKVIMGC